MYKLEDEINESDYGSIIKVNGPLVVAENMAGVKMNELVKIGQNNLLGEVIKLKNDVAFIQCYEDTTGLSISEPVLKTGKPLSAQLGPGIFNQVYDGIQRPIADLPDQSQFTLPKSFDMPSLNPKKDWLFTPYKFKKGRILIGGDIIGTVFENEWIYSHKIMLPPNAKGRVVEWQPEGNYNITQPIIELECDDIIEKYSMSHFWPVRKPRPFLNKLEGTEALITGIRVIDSLFPCVIGGKCAVPGKSGCGKSIISDALIRNSNTQANVYIGCGERANEMTEVMIELPELLKNVNGVGLPIMMKSVLIGNTSNMPLAAREASIYTGITIAEYMRDMGYDVCLKADSTTRWAEALKDISGRLGETSGDGGYPAYLGSRLAEFYERGGVVECMGTPERKGSVTMVGIVSGDSSNPVVDTTMNLVQVFWDLDVRLAQRKHFPAISWHTSFSKYDSSLKDYFNSYDSDFMETRKIVKFILENEIELGELVKKVGRDSLSEKEKLNLDVAKLIREEFLAQNIFSDYDYTCPFKKTIGMMKCFVTYYNYALKYLDNEKIDSKKRTMLSLSQKIKKEIYELNCLKFTKSNNNDDEQLEKLFKSKQEMIENKFKNELLI